MVRIDDYIYGSTLDKLYNLSVGWRGQLGEPDNVVESKYSSRQHVYLYYRPRVEKFINERRDLYDEMLARRMRRLSKEKRQQIQGVIEVAEDAELSITIPVGLETLEDLVAELHESVSQNKKIDLEGSLDVGDVYLYIRYRWTNYNSLLRLVYDRPGAGYGYQIIQTRIERGIENELIARYGESWVAELEEIDPAWL